MSSLSPGAAKSQERDGGRRKFEDVAGAVASDRGSPIAGPEKHRKEDLPSSTVSIVGLKGQTPPHGVEGAKSPSAEAVVLLPEEGRPAESFFPWEVADPRVVALQMGAAIAVVCLGLWALKWISGFISRFLREQQEEKQEKMKRRLLQARNKQMEHLETEAQNFKQTDQYKKMCQASEEREQGITSEHRRHTVTKSSDAGEGPSMYFERTLQGGFRFRPSETDRYGFRRRPGGGDGG